MISRERVVKFIGRETQLGEISSFFSANHIKRPQSLILHALGGQGKSQIALEYCHRWKETYHGIFWINASSEVTVIQSYVQIAAKLTAASSRRLEDAEADIRLVKNRLEGWNERWLLVFDNYDEPDKFPTVKRFLPCGISLSYIII
jgi:hypothetical protein